MGALLLALCLAIAAAAVGTPAPAASLDACSLLTLRDVMPVIGAAATLDRKASDEGACAYNAGSNSAGLYVFSPGADPWRLAKAGGTKVDGVGDEAYLDNAGGLLFRKGARIYAFVIDVGEPVRDERLEHAVARLVAAKLSPGAGSATSIDAQSVIAGAATAAPCSLLTLADAKPIIGAAARLDTKRSSDSVCGYVAGDRYVALFNFGAGEEIWRSGKEKASKVAGVGDEAYRDGHGLLFRKDDAIFGLQLSTGDGQQSDPELAETLARQILTRMSQAAGTTTASASVR